MLSFVPPATIPRSARLLCRELRVLAEHQNPRRIHNVGTRGQLDRRCSGRKAVGQTLKAFPSHNPVRRVSAPRRHRRRRKTRANALRDTPITIHLPHVSRLPRRRVRLRFAPCGKGPPGRMRIWEAQHLRQVCQELRARPIEEFDRAGIHRGDLPCVIKTDVAAPDFANQRVSGLASNVRTTASTSPKRVFPHAAQQGRRSSSVELQCNATLETVFSGLQRSAQAVRWISR